MSLEAITKIRAVEDSMEQSKAEAKAQAQKLIAEAEREGKALLQQGREKAAAAAAAAMKEAENAGERINEWLVRQASIVDTMKSGLETMDRDDMETIMDYLGANLSRNADALMYYCCFGYDGGVFPADHSTLDLDPSTRGWWNQAD